MRSGGRPRASFNSTCPWVMTLNCNYMSCQRQLSGTGCRHLPCGSHGYFISIISSALHGLKLLRLGCAYGDPIHHHLRPCMALNCCDSGVPTVTQFIIISGPVHGLKLQLRSGCAYGDPNYNYIQSKLPSLFPTTPRYTFSNFPFHGQGLRRPFLCHDL